MKHTVFLALGTNLGHKEKNLEQARQQIAERIGFLSAVSSVIETEPWGFESTHSFLNQVVMIKTSLTPYQVLSETQGIEIEMGRTQKSGMSYQDRLIDIDIILYDNLIVESENLQVPHPLFHKRRFVLEPLAEIAPDLIHPLRKKSMLELLQDIS